MTVATINTLSEGTGVQFDPAGDNGLVLADAVLISTEDDAIRLDDGESITVYGLAYGDNSGLGATSTSGGRVLVADTGRLTGGINGIRFEAASGFASVRSLINNGEIVGITDDGIDGAGSGCVIVNNGSISGTFGIFYSSPNSDSVEIVNNGTITSTGSRDFGIFMSVNSGGVIRNSGTITNGIDYESVSGGVLIENTGTISADAAGNGIIDRGSSQGDTIINSGSISGQVSTGDGADVVTNAGTILGTVDLSTGDDTYRALAGGNAEAVLGGAGNDTLIGGSASDTIDGGDDLDLVRGGAGDDELSGGLGDDILRGGSGDDTLGGSTGLDVIVGGSGDDLLLGGSSDDTISGGAGDDRINGGANTDLLSGGAGSDVFVLAVRNHSGRGAAADVIEDFETGIDQIDISALADSAFIFRGTGSFLTVPSVRFSVEGNNVRIQIDVDGNARIDSEILLLGTGALTAADFLL